MNPCSYFQLTVIITDSLSESHISTNVISLFVIPGVTSLFFIKKEDTCHVISFFDIIEFLKQNTLIFHLLSPSLYNTTTQDRERKGESQQLSPSKKSCYTTQPSMHSYKMHIMCDLCRFLLTCIQVSTFWFLALFFIFGHCDGLLLAKCWVPTKPVYTSLLIRTVRGENKDGLIK